MSSNTVVLKQSTPNKELKAATATIKPGMLLSRTSANLATPHAVQGGVAQKMFAKEDDLQGKGIDDLYASGAPVQYFVAKPGDEINALLKAAANIAVGDLLTSAGDGTLEKVGSGDLAIAVALQASNVAGVARVAVEIL